MTSSKKGISPFFPTTFPLFLLIFLVPLLPLSAKIDLTVLLRTIGNSMFGSFVTSEKGGFKIFLTEKKVMFDFVTSDKDNLKNLLQNKQHLVRFSMIEHRVAYSARSFAKSSFSDVTKFQNEGLPMVRSQAD